MKLQQMKRRYYQLLFNAGCYLAVIVLCLLVMLRHADAAVESVAPVSATPWSGVGQSASAAVAAGQFSLAACQSWVKSTYGVTTVGPNDCVQQQPVNTCPVPASGSAYTLNPVTNMCERTVTAPPPPTCIPPATLNVNTNMCEGQAPGCVTTTLVDGTTSTVCGNQSPLVCQPGQTVGTFNGTPMCAGGSKSLTAPPAAPAPVSGYTGPTNVTNNTVNNTTNNSTTTTTSTGSTTTGTSTGTSTTTVDMAPVVGAVNQTTAAVNSVAQAVSANSISAFCQANPTALSCVAGTFASPTLNTPSPSSGNFYTPKYPNGITGVLTDGFNNLKASPLGGLINHFNFTGGGSFDGCVHIPGGRVGGFAMPQADMCLSSTVMNFLGLFMVVTALFAARRIVFGG